MINADVTARTGAADAPGSVRSYGKQGADDDRAGFSKTLNGLDDGARQKKSDAKDGADAGQAADDVDSADDAVSTKPRTTLELSARVLLGQSLGQNGGQSGQADMQPSRISIADAGLAGAAVSDQDLAQAATAEDMLAAHLTGKRDAAASAIAGNTRKADADEADAPTDETDTDAETTTAAAPQEQLNDVLSLLSGAAAEAASAALMPRQAGQAQPADLRTTKPVASATAAQASAASEASDALDLSVDADTSAVDERTFRLSSARGSQSLDMTISADDKGKVSFDTEASSGGNAENVVVLDSRRFLGFGMGTNGAALTAAISGDESWSAAMRSSAALTDPTATSGTGDVVNTLKLQMNPHNLGAVTATLRLAGDALTVHLTVENHAAMRHLNDDSTGILDALRSQGFTVDQVTVSVASSAQSDGSNSQQQGQQAGQQALDGRQGNGAGRGQNQAGQSQTGEGIRGNNETVSDTAADGGARPDHLYL